VVYIATFEVAGGARSHRELIAQELTAIYEPHCNLQSTTKHGRTSGSGVFHTGDDRPARPTRA
jgi:hypothetical protein